MDAKTNLHETGGLYTWRARRSRSRSRSSSTLHTRQQTWPEARALNKGLPPHVALTTSTTRGRPSCGLPCLIPPIPIFTCSDNWQLLATRVWQPAEARRPFWPPAPGADSRLAGPEPDKPPVEPRASSSLLSTNTTTPAAVADIHLVGRPCIFLHRSRLVRVHNARTKRTQRQGTSPCILVA